MIDRTRRHRCIRLCIGIYLAACVAGCVDEPPPLSAPPQLDPATAKADYWLARPAAASVYSGDYDQLWDLCGNVARDDLFTLDREDYRDGLLTTHPMVSKQIFEFWRNDSGDAYSVAENSLQTIRRTIQFQFDRFSGGATVTPKVVVERLAQQESRLTSTALYRGAVANSQRDSREYWYATGRDLAMEAELAREIRKELLVASY